MMILSGMDYLTILMTFGQTGEIIQKGNLWSEFDNSPSEFRGSTVWGWGQRKAPPNPGALRSSTTGTGN